MTVATTDMETEIKPHQTEIGYFFMYHLSTRADFTINRINLPCGPTR